MAYRSGDNPPAVPHRVVVTGAGIVTAHGCGWQANADAVREGRVSLKPVTLFDVTRQRVATAGQVDLPANLPPHRLPTRIVGRLDRGSHLLLHALHETLTSAGWTAGKGGKDEKDTLLPVPLCLGTSAGAMTLGEEFHRRTLTHPESRGGQTTRALFYQTHTQSVLAARAFGITGPVTLLSNACASGANAIGHAFQLLRRGQAPRALAGGYDALCHLVFAGFDSLKALSTTRPRPFDSARDGLALGEGAALLALETLEHATARGARILAEVTGYGASTDLHHLTQPDPEGGAAFDSMTQACRMAGMGAEGIDYLNSHGTGTPLNDSAEGRAIQRWAGEHVGRIAVSSTKGGMGHLLGGAGAVEAVISLMALHGDFLPPNVAVDAADAVCTFALVQKPEARALRAVLTNSFGFGGSNATLVFQKPPGFMESTASIQSIQSIQSMGAAAMD
ncbi:MAG: beta-ketoacyl-[acyl-carrier-protein] synthase family protein [Verrucomicrobiaceae bacterium]|nr:MAG: beta-ketoacyl-[acyl-carrier-protein] synthase family protein [Verrucomicrobiaceae bacterium]